jgi:ribonuclease P protein component
MFQLHARPNAMPQARLGIVISKRVIDKAVARNYCKRLMREVFRAVSSSLSGTDIVVRPRQPVTRANAAAARAELSGLLRTACRRCGRPKQAHTASPVRI